MVKSSQRRAQYLFVLFLNYFVEAFSSLPVMTPLHRCARQNRLASEIISETTVNWWEAAFEKHCPVEEKYFIHA